MARATDCTMNSPRCNSLTLRSLWQRAAVGHRALIFLAFLAIGLVVVFSLGGCAAPQLLKGSGEATPPPTGYIVECAKSPSLENCK